jgi:hypothetical protein
VARTRAMDPLHTHRRASQRHPQRRLGRRHRRVLLRRRGRQRRLEDAQHEAQRPLDRGGREEQVRGQPDGGRVVVGLACGGKPRGSGKRKTDEGSGVGKGRLGRCDGSVRRSAHKVTAGEVMAADRSTARGAALGGPTQPRLPDACRAHVRRPTHGRHYKAVPVPSRQPHRMTLTTAARFPRTPPRGHLGPEEGKEGRQGLQPFALVGQGPWSGVQREPGCWWRHPRCCGPWPSHCQTCCCPGQLLSRAPATACRAAHPHRAGPSSPRAHPPPAAGMRASRPRR